MVNKVILYSSHAGDNDIAVKIDKALKLNTKTNMSRMINLILNLAKINLFMAFD